MISVIIPVYNVEKYLVECVNSVINQTYRDIEIILVDDGSTDNSGLICDELKKKDSRIVVIHKQNEGLSDARNAGFKCSHGEYIYFLDSDDYIKDYALERMLSVIDRDKADIVCFDAETIYEDFEDKKYREYYTRKNDYITDKGATTLYKQIIAKDYYVCVPFMLFRRKFLKNNHLLFKKGIIHEDILFTTIAFVRADRVSFVREKLYTRRMRSGSIMSSRISSKSLEGFFVCMDYLVKELGKYPVNSEEKKALHYGIKLNCYFIFETYALLDRKKRYNFRNRMKRLGIQVAEVNKLGKITVLVLFFFPQFYLFLDRLVKKLVP